eukprot:270817_1
MSSSFRNYIAKKKKKIQYGALGFITGATSGGATGAVMAVGSCFVGGAILCAAAPLAAGAGAAVVATQAIAGATAAAAMYGAPAAVVLGSTSAGVGGIAGAIKGAKSKTKKEAVLGAAADGAICGAIIGGTPIIVAGAVASKNPQAGNMLLKKSEKYNDENSTNYHVQTTSLPLAAAPSKKIYNQYKHQQKYGVKSRKKRAGLWEGGIVPYTIDVKYSEVRKKIEQAVKHHNNSIENVKWVKKPANYNGPSIKFNQNDKKKPGSWVGSRGIKDQKINIPKQFPKSKTKIKKGNILHEMTHAIGFHHEHARLDRDKYVKIDKKHQNNSNYSKVAMPMGEYDFESITQYRNGVRCHDPKNNKKIGNRIDYSDGDKRAINEIYKFEKQKLEKKCNSKSGGDDKICKLNLLV